MRRGMALLMVLLLLCGCAAANAAVDRVINMKETELTLEAGKKVKIEPEVVYVQFDAPRVKFGWESSDEKVAKVSNGTVTGVGAGTAVITAYAKDDPTIRATVNVTVVSKVKKITPAGKKLTVPLGYPTKAAVTLTPENPTNPALVWASSDEAVATVDENGVITPVAEGKCEITAAPADEGGAKPAAIAVEVKRFDVVITEPGPYTTTFSTASFTVKEVSTVQKVKVTKGCVKITGDKELTPVKAGEDLIKTTISTGGLTTMMEHTVYVAESAIPPKE